ncbi:hypothetical protein H8356DRAFT_1326465 [Neocallimastix lanati (nom. inval.)]|nr:hypothetical protein H8356DRAFT_1326465 [Neocallimastix sp. JGI-2020a]
MKLAFFISHAVECIDLRTLIGNYRFKEEILIGIPIPDQIEWYFHYRYYHHGHDELASFSPFSLNNNLCWSPFRSRRLSSFI